MSVDVCDRLPVSARGIPYRLVLLLGFLVSMPVPQAWGQRGATSPRDTIIIRLTSTGPDTKGPTRVTGTKRRTAVLLTGFNPLNPSTYQMTVSGTSLATTDADLYGWVAGVLKTPALTSAPVVPATANVPTDPKPPAKTAGTLGFVGPKRSEPPACPSMDLGGEYKEKLSMLEGLRYRVNAEIDRANRLRDQVRAVTLPYLATRSQLQGEIADLTKQANDADTVLRALSKPLETLQTSDLPGATAAAEVAARTVRNTPACSEQLKTAMDAQVTRFLTLERDGATVREAYRVVANLIATVRGGLTLWQTMVLNAADSTAFTAVATLDPPTKATIATITVQRSTPAAQPAPTPLSMPTLLSTLTAPPASPAAAKEATATAPAPSGTPPAANPVAAPTPTTVATVALIQDVRPTVTFSAGALLTPLRGTGGYRAATYAVQDIPGDSVRLTETERDAQTRAAPVGLIQVHVLDWLAVAAGGTLAKGPGTDALALEPFAGFSVAPTHLIPYAYFSIGVLSYRAAVVRDAVPLNTTVLKAAAPNPLYALRNRTAFALAVTWRVR